MKLSTLLPGARWKALRTYLSGARLKTLQTLLHFREDRFVRQVFGIQRAYEVLGANSTYILQSWNAFLNELKRARISMKSMRKFHEFSNGRDLQVELGSGPDTIRSGWINIDMSLSEDEKDDVLSNEGSTYIDYDLRLGLPLPDGSCKFIYSSHFFEHLEYLDAVNLLQDCHRCLQDGGHLRLALPNFRPYVTAYLNRDYDYLRVLNHYQIGVPEGEVTLADFLSRGVYESGEHKYIYDPEKCIKLLSKIGFKQVTESVFLDGMDLATRRPYTFYIEAVK